MAATSKAGFGHADRSSDGGEALDSETSASEEGLAAAEGVKDSFDCRRRAEVCGDNSLGQMAPDGARDLVASLARELICDALGTGRNMVTLLASEVQTEKNVYLDLDLFPTSAAWPVF